MSKNLARPVLMAVRRSSSDWYGVRQAIALALASAPSNDGPVEAPAMTPILNSRPARCSRSAWAAIAFEMALGAPAGVKPENATLLPCLMWLAASSGVIRDSAIFSPVILPLRFRAELRQYVAHTLGVQVRNRNSVVINLGYHRPFLTKSARAPRELEFNPIATGGHCDITSQFDPRRVCAPVHTVRWVLQPSPETS